MRGNPTWLSNAAVEGVRGGGLREVGTRVDKLLQLTRRRKAMPS